MIQLFFLTFIISTFLQGEQSTLIITHHFNRPDFIELQHKTLKAFMKSPYEFVVFNDAKTEELNNAIESICHDLDIKCIRIPQSIHSAPKDAAICCADVVQYSLDVLGFDYNGYVMILDADMFLLEPFDVNQYMENTLIAGHPQNRGHVNYIWNGILIMDMVQLPNKKSIHFGCGIVDGQLCDVGGNTYYYFQEHPKVFVKPMVPHHYLQYNRHRSRDHLPPKIAFCLRRKICDSEFFIGTTFFHYRSGGNWNGQSERYHQRKTHRLLDLIDFAMYQ